MRLREACAMELLASSVVVGASWGAPAATVSPGSDDRVAKIEARCPSFSWATVPEAEVIELVVFELLPGMGAYTFDLTEAELVVYEQLPGATSSWTPSLDRCLEPGGRYAWFVRGTSAGTVSEDPAASEWSQARLFEVLARPSPEELDAALAVLRRYRETEDIDSAVARPSRSTAGGDRGRTAGGPPPRTTGRTRVREHLGVPTATAGIRSRSPDDVGETYGVVGTSSSPDGAGLGAINVAGGADLVLDGFADGQTDTAISQSGIYRSSGLAETFTISNSGGGTIELDVAGVISGDGSGLVSVNAETLDGLFSTDLAALSDLATSGAASVHWDNLTSVPADLADGDDDTSYDSLCQPGQVVGGLASDGSVTCVADSDTTYSGATFALSDQSCPPGSYLSAISSSGALLCTSLTSWINTNCYVYLGWRDVCDGCSPELAMPTKRGRTRGLSSGCQTVGAHGTCTNVDLDSLDGGTVQLLGVNTDGDVNGNDTFFVGFKCE